MAGDWIKMEVGLPEKPEVWQIAGMVGIDADSVVGKLLKVWRWFDAHTESGSARGTPQLLDAICGQPGFADALVAAGWLVVADGRLTTVNFDKHNGKTGKMRAETARRVANHRKQCGNDNVTKKTLPRPVVQAIKARDGGCVYCSRKEGEYTPPETPGDALMCIDHVVPVSVGGTDDPQNLVCACSSCNLFKSNRTPDECGLPWPLDEIGNRRGVTSALAREEKRREEKKEKEKPRRGKEVTFAEWAVSLAGDDAIPADDPIFAWAGKQGIPADWIGYAWAAFEDRYAEKDKTYADWRAAFRDHVKRGWLEVWRLDGRSGGYVLTTAGEQWRREVSA